MLWELTELAVRYELIVVDRALAAAVRANADVAAARDEDIGMVFLTTSFDSVVHMPLPGISMCLATAVVGNRRDALNYLASLMSCWPGAPSFFTQGLPPDTDSSYFDVEQQVIVFYLQTVYEFFHRRPSVPCLPLNVKH